MATNNSNNDHHVSNGHRRNPESTQAWVIGGGIASLATAVFLIKDAKVPASNIHIFDLHSHPGGGIGASGDVDTGYVLSSGQHISFHDACVERLLSLIPSGTDSTKTLWNDIVSLNDQKGHHERPVNRLFVDGPSGIKPLRAKNLGLDLHSRIELIKLMLEREEVLGDKSIADTFHADFFCTKFWKTWSTT
jgi:oleate hydratase